MTDPQARDLLLALTPQPLPPNPAFPRSAVCRGAGDVSFAGDVGGRSTSGSGGDGGAGVRGDAGAGSSTSLSAHAEAYARAEAEALAEDPLCGADTRSLFALRRSRRYRAGTVAFVQWRRGWYAVRLTEVNPRAPTAKVTFLPPYAAYPDEWKHWWEIHFDDEAARGAAVTKAAAARRVRAVTQRTRYWPMATHPCTHAFLRACGACGDGGGGEFLMSSLFGRSGACLSRDARGAAACGGQHRTRARVRPTLPATAAAGARSSKRGRGAGACGRRRRARGCDGAGVVDEHVR